MNGTLEVLPRRAAVVQSEPQKPAASFLTREIVPYQGAEFGIPGRVGSTLLRLVENPDPILRHFSANGERTFVLMQREAAIGNAKRKRIANTLRAGSEVVAGNKTREARELRDLGIALLKRVHNFRTVQRRAYDACFWGWRPFELVYAFDRMTWKGHPLWCVPEIRQKRPWDFRFTTNRELAWVGSPGQKAQVFTGDDALKWWVCTSGDTDSPYGDALLSELWPLYVIKTRFLQQFARGMARSVGSLIYEEQGLASETFADSSGPGGSAVKSLGEIADDVRELCEVWDETAVIISRADAKIKPLTEMQFADGWEKALRYIDEGLRMGILGETIAGVRSSEGSRSAAEVGERDADDPSVQDAAEAETWISDGLIGRLIRLNLGDDVPAEILPRWRSKIGRSFAMADAQAFVALGGRLDSKAVAEAKGLPIADDEDPDAEVLERQPLPEALGGDGGEDDGEDGSGDKPRGKQEPPKRGKEKPKRLAPGDRARERGERTAQEDFEASIDRAVDDAAEAGRKHVERLAREYLRRNPDPFGLAPSRS